jgi:hypothetical protein
MTLLLSTTIDPLKLINFANMNPQYCHKKQAIWAMKQDLKENLMYQWYHKNRMALKLIKLPVIVEIIRISPRKQDYDNYVYNCKCIRDYIADCLIPGKAAGQADNDSRIEWIYRQQKGETKQYALNILLWQN